MSRGTPLDNRCELSVRHICAWAQVYDAERADCLGTTHPRVSASALRTGPATHRWLDSLTLAAAWYQCRLTPETEAMMSPGTTEARTKAG